MIDTLTKENFWDSMSREYPKTMEHLMAWIDQYKSDHNWDRLFNGRIQYSVFSKDSKFDTKLDITESPKFHQLPVAMQVGIIIEYYYFCKLELKWPLGHINMPVTVPLLQSTIVAIPALFRGLEDFHNKS